LIVLNFETGTETVSQNAEANLRPFLGNTAKIPMTKHVAVLYNTAGMTHKQWDLRAFMNHFIQMFGSIKYCDVFLKPFSIRTL
jgi:hypothetical protein